MEPTNNYNGFGSEETYNKIFNQVNAIVESNYHSDCLMVTTGGDCLGDYCFTIYLDELKIMVSRAYTDEENFITQVDVDTAEYDFIEDYMLTTICEIRNAAKNGLFDWLFDEMEAEEE